MFRPFPNWPSSGWIQCQRNYTPTINIVISVSVSTEKSGGGRNIVYKRQGLCADWWWRLNTCTNRVGIVCLLLVNCVGSRGLGLAALLSGGVWVSKWSAVVAVWSFRAERGGGSRCAAAEGVGDPFSSCW